MKLVVFDLEHTYWDEKAPARIAQIIEIGAVKVDLHHGAIVGSWSSLVRPPHQSISDYCTMLTGITQQDLRGKPQFPEAYAHFANFCGSKHEVILAGWGDDLTMLDREITMTNTRNRHTRNYWNVSHLFSARYGMGSTNLKKALAHVGLEFEGDPHRALTDAHNTARLLIHMFHPAVTDSTPMRPATPWPGMPLTRGGGSLFQKDPRHDL